jgi:hypothetical protein
MRIEISTYLRELADRCNKIARSCTDLRAQEALGEIGVELAEKAEALESACQVPK